MTCLFRNFHMTLLARAITAYPDEYESLQAIFQKQLRRRAVYVEVRFDPVLVVQ